MEKDASADQSGIDLATVSPNFYGSQSPSQPSPGLSDDSIKLREFEIISRVKVAPQSRVNVSLRIKSIFVRKLSEGGRGQINFALHYSYSDGSQGGGFFSPSNQGYWRMGEGDTVTPNVDIGPMEVKLGKVLEMRLALRDHDYDHIAGEAYLLATRIDPGNPGNIIYRFGNSKYCYPVVMSDGIHIYYSYKGAYEVILEHVTSVAAEV